MCANPKIERNGTQIKTQTLDHKTNNMLVNTPFEEFIALLGGSGFTKVPPDPRRLAPARQIKQKRRQPGASGRCDHLCESRERRALTASLAFEPSGTISR